MATKVCAITIARDEADIIEYTIRHLFAEGIDQVIVGLHQSDDPTRRLVGRMSMEMPLLARFFPDPHFRQAEMMTQLANAAHSLGADWIVPFDADELHCSVGGVFADRLRDSSDEALGLRMTNYVAAGLDDPSDPNPFTREQWTRPAWNPLNKVVFRWQPGIAIAPGSHSVSVAGRRVPEGLAWDLFIGHFQNRSPEQFIRKIRNEVKGYAGLSKDIGYWHNFGHLSDAEITQWWQREYYVSNPQAAGLIHDPAPYMAHELIPA